LNVDGMRCDIHGMDVKIFKPYHSVSLLGRTLRMFEKDVLSNRDTHYTIVAGSSEAKSRVNQYAWQVFHNAGTILEETLAGIRHRDFQGCDTPANSLQYHH
jgi:hypothetical protein